MTLSGHSAPAAPLSGGDFAAALDWWRDAGVDLDFIDEARSWLAQPEPAAASGPAPFAAAPPPPPPEPERIVAKNTALPDTLPQFVEWWLSEPALDSGIVERRVPPRGSAGAPLMVLVPHPEAEDGERLLSGPQGRLLDAILAALGIAPDAAYVASCLPRHMPLPDWDALREAGLGEVVIHHIALAAPQRVLMLGLGISSLLGHDPTKKAEQFTQLSNGGAIWPVMAAPGLDSLGARPRGKARLWQGLIGWMG